MCQHSDTAQCEVIGNSNMTHTKRCYYNVLRYLTSPLLTECESKTVTDNSSNTYSNSWYTRLILHLGARPLMVGSFTLWPLYSLYLLKRRLCGLHRRWTVWQRCAACRQWVAGQLLIWNSMYSHWTRTRWTWFAEKWNSGDRHDACGQMKGSEFREKYGVG
jgi:hypothetical protein